MRNGLIAVAALLALGGCIKFDTSPPKGLPAYVHLYPGAQQKAHVQLGERTDDFMTTTDTPDAVVSWYRSGAVSDGLSEVTAPQPATAVAAQRQGVWGDRATNRMLIVIARPADSEPAGTTMINLSWQTPKGAAQ